LTAEEADDLRIKTKKYLPCVHLLDIPHMWGGTRGCWCNYLMKRTGKVLIVKLTLLALTVVLNIKLIAKINGERQTLDL